MQRLLIGFCALFSTLVPTLVQAATLTPPKGGQYAIIVQGNGGIEFARNADDMIAPASTMKVLTALAARLELGADFRFATDIQAQPGAKQGDAINGDIWINFVGDPTLSRMDLLALFKQLGVNRIKGNVYVNTGAYNGYERGNGWSWGIRPSASPPPSPLSSSTRTAPTPPLQPPRLVAPPPATSPPACPSALAPTGWT
ncbi:D-alanyl-D-alanine carboxypeptidase/D-alanyl-D-alanine-endopeptidase [Aeromonas salmonicida]|nr:D-alanyl-D-alanine carboxypeptidase/D-alanyl-D-alanine-endopeptidase [Aeromonas salmonicida]